MTATRGITGNAVDGHATAAEQLTAIQARTAKLAAAWESTSPSDAATALYDLEHRTDVLSRGVRRAGAAVDWAKAHAQIFLMEAQALADLGRPVDALRSARGAIAQAMMARDPVSATHGRVIASTVVRAARATADPGKLLIAACSTADAGHATAIGRTVRANAMAAAGARVDDVWNAVRAAEAAPLGTGEPGFALDGWDPAIRASHLGAALAKCGLVAPARDRLDMAADAFGPDPDGEVRAPGAFAMVLLYRARLALATGDFDGAEAHTGRALDIADGRPSATVAGGALTLAQAAGARGVRWYDVRARARAAMPVSAV
jgi:hypothetical protein